VSFQAHSLVLASVSPSFCVQIQQERAKCAGLDGQVITIHLHSCGKPEAVEDMLHCMYGPFVDSREPSCQTEAANRDAIQLAVSYQIPQLQIQASRWLVNGLTTENVLERLAICEEFGLAEVRERILETILLDPIALPVLAKDPEILKAPKVLQDLLLRILTLLGCISDPSSKDVPPMQSISQGKSQGKQARKAGIKKKECCRCARKQALD